MSGSAVTGHGVLLAGGAGSRLGFAKPSAELGGRPLIDYPLTAMRDAGLAVTIVAKRGSELPAQCLSDGRDWPRPNVIREPDAPLHPLLGIATALELLDSPAVFCACDMPFVTSALLAWIAGLDEANVAVPRRGEVVDSLIGRYTPGALPELRAALDAGGSARSAVECAGLRAISEAELARFGTPARLLFDVDTPEDLELATRMIELNRSAE
ncbi:MAG: molybdenum cofactor guanylyltransferase [Thermoleophilaceae bacterium]|nr:molybdenum cofactor guanylyltransferase [Thermoleophilaceae bacterium]